MSGRQRLLFPNSYSSLLSLVDVSEVSDYLPSITDGGLSVFMLIGEAIMAVVEPWDLHSPGTLLAVFTWHNTVKSEADKIDAVS